MHNCHAIDTIYNVYSYCSFRLVCFVYIKVSIALRNHDITSRDFMARDCDLTSVILWRVILWNATQILPESLLKYSLSKFSPKLNKFF